MFEGSARKYALQNAVRYGKASVGPVMGKIMAEFPEVRKRSGEVKEIIVGIVDEVNSLSPERRKSELEATAPELLEKKKGVKRTGLPDLPEVDGDVIMRFAPGPSGPLHIGHTRAAVLNDEYVKKYGGKYILRLEDTNPGKIDPEAYDTIPQDMEWLGIKVHEVYRQSDRFQLYYDEARKILEGGNGYVCTCPAEEWRGLKNQKKPCPHRGEDVSLQLERWEKMLSGDYGPGEATMVTKTDLDSPNPALRDFASFRIVNEPHPMTGSKYCVYPLYNFSVVIDDHLMGMTHVLRGKDHLNNTLRQAFVYEYNGWKKPHFTHYGWVSIEGTLLKTSLIKEGIMEGKYSGWDDVQLGTLRAMNKRGIRPEAFRKYWVDVGTKGVDINFSWETLYAFNKEVVDPESPRFFFVADPLEFSVSTTKALVSKAPKHPDNPKMGVRSSTLENSAKVFLASSDEGILLDGNIVRLKDLGNFRLDSGALTYENNDLSLLKKGVKVVHWVLTKDSLPCKISLPSGKEEEGRIESAAKGITGVVQLERYGFVNLEDWDGQKARGAFSHR